jgi:putative salt-induced outer membrane protein
MKRKQLDRGPKGNGQCNGRAHDGVSARARALGAGATLVVAVGLLAEDGQAQAPAGLTQVKPASSGATEVAKAGFQSVAPQEEGKDAQSFKVSVGGFWAAGNARNLALTGVSDYRVRRGDSQFTALAAVNYGQAGKESGDGYKATVENYQGNVRYDQFFGGPLAGFLSASARQDRFQQLDLRLNIDPGLAYYFIDEKVTLLWGELGYDLQYDVRRKDAVDVTRLDPAVADLERTETRHNLRAFTGFSHKFSDTVAFDTSLEYLQALKDTENWRLNGGAGFTSQLAESFSLATTFTLKFDHNPLPGVKQLDTITAFNLVYQLK